jgi:6-phosphogluconolactonase
VANQLRNRFFIASNAAALARRAAREFVEAAEDAVAARGRVRIAISGGSSPRAVFELLANPAQPWRERMNWEQVDFWWVDERCVPPDHPDSNYRMTREALLDRVPLEPGQIHRIQGELDPETAAARYESEMRNSFDLKGAAIPAFDLIALGMGADGHTASLFPGTAALHETGRLAVANFVPQQKDNWRLTLTAPVINRARRAFFLIDGADKAQSLKEVIAGARDPERFPSQLIQPSGAILLWILGQTAAALLPVEALEDSCGLEREE